MTALTAPHDIAPPNPVSVHRATHQHRPLFRAFLAATRVGPSDTILDVGVTRDRDREDANYLDTWYAHKNRVTAAGLDEAFDDGSFDYVHARGVLGNISDRESQAEFLRQAWRVARKGIFITVPSRRFTLRRPDRRVSEQTLTGLSAADFLRLAYAAGIANGEIWRVSPFLRTTNLVLVALRH